MGANISDDSIKPSITVVTVVYNDVGGISETIKSVLEQDYNNIYYVIVDGCSDDGTLEAIEGNRHYIDAYISEPDKGISDAFNKGVALSKEGSYVIFLNSGDVFLDKHTVTRVAHKLNERIDILSARVVVEKSKLIPPFKVTIKARTYKRLMVAHQGLFVRKEILQGEGGFNVGLKVRMDFDLLFRLVDKYKWDYYQEPVVKYSLDGVSSLNFYGFWKEGFEVAKANKASIFVKMELIFRFLVNLVKRLV